MTGESVDNDILDFLSYVRSERALSVNTGLAYENDLSEFRLFCLRKKKTPSQMQIRELREFLSSLRRRSLAPRSLARKVSALKQFYKFLLRENRIESNPSDLLTVVVRGRKLPKTLTENEMIRLIESASGNLDSNIRDRALLEIWYATGCRITELVSLKVSSFDWDSRVVWIVGKGGRERCVPLSHEAVKHGKQYQGVRLDWVRRRGLKDKGVFFVTRLGTGFTRQGVWKILKKYAQRAGIHRRVWPHMIRHTFATHILQGGADLRAVQEFLGHRTIATTEIYTHLDIENLKLTQIKYHPRS